jgi:excisionase family DNA binding protein
MPLDFITAEELAERLRLSADTIRLLARQGRIPSVRIGHKTIRFDLDAVARVLREPAKGKGGSRGE